MRFQRLAARAGKDIPVRVVAELILAEEAVAHRRPALRLRNMGCKAHLLASLDVLDLEVAAIGDDVDPLDAENRAGRFGSLARRPMSTTWLVTSCSTISLYLAS